MTPGDIIKTKSLRACSAKHEMTDRDAAVFLKSHTANVPRLV